MALEQRMEGGEQMRVRKGPGPSDAGCYRPWQGGWSPAPYGGWVRRERASWLCEASARRLQGQQRQLQEGTFNASSLKRSLFHQSVVSTYEMGSLKVVSSLSEEVCKQGTMAEQARVLPGVDDSVNSAEENRTKLDKNA